MSGKSKDDETVAGMFKQLSSASEDVKSFSLPTIPGLEIQKDANTGLDYFFVDDQAAGMAPLTTPVAHPTGSLGPLPMRTNSDKFLYGTGAAYVSGVTLGGLYGAYRGMRNRAIRNSPFKLKLNAVLNSTTRYGPWLGNSWGMLTFLYTGIDASLSYFRDTSDYYNHLSAAFLTGSIFKSAAGVRPALLMGSLLTVLASGFGFAYEREKLLQTFSRSTSSPSKVQSPLAL